MTILGIDPGTATTGWGIIRIKNKEFRIKNKKIHDSKFKIQKSLELIDYGCIVTTPKMALPQRLGVLRKDLRKLIFAQKPRVICIEELFFGRNRKTAMTVSKAAGVIMEAAASTKIPIFEYQGFKVKHTLTGERFAGKKEIEKSVKRLLGKRKLAKPLNGFLDDAVDGIALAIYHAITSI